MKKILVFIFPLFLFTSCYEDFDYEFLDAGPKLVVDAKVIAGERVHKVRLTQSGKEINTTDYFNNGLSDDLPVCDAVVILSDDYGQRDTLIPSRAYDYYYFLKYPEWTLDSNWGENRMSKEYGYYQTKNIRAEIGHTYFLEIYWQGEVYRSSSKIPPIPVIDSISHYVKDGAVGKPDALIPLVWFDNPKETRDYFLFSHSLSGGWGKNLLSDENMAEKVEGYSIFEGEKNNWWLNFYPSPEDFYACDMYSITKEVYDHYDALISQIRSDGGIYSPTPATPPSNISNGALGVFMAASVNYIRVYNPYSPLPEMERRTGKNPSQTH